MNISWNEHKLPKAHFLQNLHLKVCFRHISLVSDLNNNISDINDSIYLII